MKQALRAEAEKLECEVDTAAPIVAPMFSGAWTERNSLQRKLKTGMSMTNAARGFVSIHRLPMSVMKAYEVLGVEHGSSAKTCNRAYRMLQLVVHPDKAKADISADAALILNEAKEKLGF